MSAAVTARVSVHEPPSPVRDRADGWVLALVFALPLTASFSSAFGAVSVGGQLWYPYKVFVPALFALTAASSLKVLLRRQSYAWMLVALMVWGAVGLLWAKDFVEGAREVSILGFAALSTASLTAAVAVPSATLALLRGWLAAAGVTTAVAIWELVTGNHLESEFVVARAGETRGTLLSTFGNPNNYGAFVILALPFVVIVATGCARLWGATVHDARVARVFAVVLPAMLVLSASRLALFGLVAGVLVYLALERRWRSTWWLACGALASGAVFVIVLATTDVLLARKLSNLFLTRPYSLTSVESRINLFRNGIAFFFRTGGVGLGPGGYEVELTEGRNPFPVAPRTVDPHNFWIEVLSQYGVIGTFLLGAVLAAALTALLRLHRRTGQARGVARTASILVSGFAGYLLAGMSASSYINAAENWMFIASFLAMVPALHHVRRPPHPSPVERAA